MGIKVSMAFKRWFDSLTKSVSRSSDGELPTAWCKVTAETKRLCIVKFS